MPPSLLPLLFACTPEPLPRPPDIVMVVIDTLRTDHLGSYGHSRPTTPEMDALADRGLRFERAYAHSGWTLPSMTSLLTGKLPHQHRVVRDSVDVTHFGRLPPEYETLAETLATGGYTTGAVVNNTFLAPEFGLHQGFDHYDYEGALNRGHRTAEDTVELALSWLESQAGPTFLLVHFMEPHLDYDPPTRFRGSFTGTGTPPVEVPFGGWDQIGDWHQGQSEPPEATQEYVTALYDEEILASDHALGQLVDGLESRNRWNQTLLLLT
ncbi:MAG: sulfatase, partial [Myxococcota bacterium]|nr:sulfatase [Myxococcota bacterium]